MADKLKYYASCPNCQDQNLGVMPITTDKPKEKDSHFLARVQVFCRNCVQVMGIEDIVWRRM